MNEHRTIRVGRHGAALPNTGPFRLKTAILGLIFLCMAAAVSLRGDTFPDPSVDETDRSSRAEKAVLAGGCFWGMETLFEHVRGVQSVVSGYSGGDKKTAHTAQVEGGKTSHAESVMITYDPSKITYGQILKIFFSVAHDPTQLNRQGGDTGTQYRSVIFYASEEQKKAAENYIAQLEAAKVFPSKIVTEVVSLKGFYPAEAFLQHYSEKHPDDQYVVQVDLPKLRELKQKFPELANAPKD